MQSKPRRKTVRSYNTHECNTFLFFMFPKCFENNFVSTLHFCTTFLLSFWSIKYNASKVHWNLWMQHNKMYKYLNRTSTFAGHIMTILTVKSNCYTKINIISSRCFLKQFHMIWCFFLKKKKKKSRASKTLWPQFTEWIFWFPTCF